MKKLVLFVCLLVATVAAQAQFEKRKVDCKSVNFRVRFVA